MAGTIAIDLFENQAANIDKSGEGDRSEFLRNLDRWADRSDLPETDDGADAPLARGLDS